MSEVSGIHPTLIQSFLNLAVCTQSFTTKRGRARGPGGRLGSASIFCLLLSAHLPSRSLLLPDGKNQLLLALLKCTGEGFERAAVCNVHMPGTPGRGCPGYTCRPALVTAAQGLLSCRPRLTSSGSLGPACEGGSPVASSALRTSRTSLPPPVSRGQVSAPGARSTLLRHLPGLG